MSIDRDEKQFRPVAVPESEIPDWYAQRLVKALLLMSERTGGSPPPAYTEIFRPLPNSQAYSA